MSHEDRRRIALPRRATKGPLEDDAFDSPNVDSVSTSPAPASITVAQRGNHTNIKQTAQDFTYLLQASNFHPVPNDTVPAPFLSSPNQPLDDTPLGTLLANGHFRIAASAASAALRTSVAANDNVRIFELWYIRLACLTLCGATSIAAQESKALGDLGSSFYHDPVTGAHLVPWGLRVMSVRLQALGFGEWRRGIMGYFELAKEARAALVAARKRQRLKSKDVVPEALPPEVWEARLRELEVRVADAMVEMGDPEPAAEHVRSARASRDAVGSEHLDSTASLQSSTAMEIMIHLSLGDLSSARQCIASPQSTPRLAVLEALLATCEGLFPNAVERWRSLHASNPADTLVAQNLAVCLVYTGRLQEARNILSKLHEEGTNKPLPALTFNSATLYELCNERASEKKLEMAARDAQRVPMENGWEGMNVDYKM